MRWRAVAFAGRCKVAFSLAISLVNGWKKFVNGIVDEVV